MHLLHIPCNFRRIQAVCLYGKDWPLFTGLEVIMYRKFLLGAVLTLASHAITVNAVADPASPSQNSVMLPAAANAGNLTAQFKESLGLEVVSVKPSAMNGLLEVITDQGLFYASSDGKFLIHGKMYGLGQNITNLTEESLAQVRIEGMSKFKNDMIVFPAENEKHVVTVFTDITCGYCRKMHDQMDDYNAKGITIRYLAYPRAGIKDRTGQYSQGFKDLRSIWCHEDPKSALTKAKSGSNVASRICKKPIEEEFDFGRQVGVSGTPAIMLSDGMMVPGYQDPSKLLMILESSQRG